MRYIYHLSVLVLTSTFAACSSAPAEQGSGTVQAGGLQVYFETQGKGDPLLLLHAGLQNSTMWAEQVKELSKDHKVITIDLPFHGRTVGIDTTLLASDVVRIVLDSLRIVKAAVAGLSMGASVAQDFVIDHPERVTRAIFISAGINGYEKTHPVDSASAAWYTSFAAALTAKDTAAAAMAFSKAWGEGIDFHGDSLTKPASRYVYETTLATLHKHKMAGWPNLRDEPTAYDRLGTIRVPVLLIHGDKDLPYITEANSYLETAIPGSKRVLLKGAAHMLNLEQPGEVNRLLTSFLSGS
jgi:pimeloyl-ACP methyl ester carboxylesterase